MTIVVNFIDFFMNDKDERERVSSEEVEDFLGIRAFKCGGERFEVRVKNGRACFQ